MGIQEDLDSLRKDVPGCEVVAYADIDAGLVLVASSDSSPRRELLDELCGVAVRHFAKAAYPGLEAPDMALERSHNKPVQVFLRNLTEPTEVVCAICKPDTDLDAYITNARDLLDRTATASGDDA